MDGKQDDFQDSARQTPPRAIFRNPPRPFAPFGIGGRSLQFAGRTRIGQRTFARLGAALTGTLALLMFCGAAVFACLAVSRLASSRRIALAAALIRNRYAVLDAATPAFGILGERAANPDGMGSAKYVVSRRDYEGGRRAHAPKQVRVSL